ncbi:hypothetical protein K450DRAFT_255377 [Umbelopsis ramanniana AG]|uniref:Uncharacterized protein n=1 Tax=Umbelopsis ramanniana AG TaxID=1314678 RepID=A0AAD5E6T9_UMBRA|nr:uncharacterized protein K450DRAFT_255377 [Umbelopsis ramanniana AG]KAI8576745.1 hypothetical protein K450DRAFT_255377 [Umbelopsis ramanniana AG]
MSCPEGFLKPQSPIAKDCYQAILGPMSLVGSPERIEDEMSKILTGVLKKNENYAVFAGISQGFLHNLLGSAFMHWFLHRFSLKKRKKLLLKKRK